MQIIHWKTAFLDSLVREKGTQSERVTQIMPYREQNISTLFARPQSSVGECRPFHPTQLARTCATLNEMCNDCMHVFPDIKVRWYSGWSISGFCWMVVRVTHFAKPPASPNYWILPSPWHPNPSYLYCQNSQKSTKQDGRPPYSNSIRSTHRP